VHLESYRFIGLRSIEHGMEGTMKLTAEELAIYGLIDAEPYIRLTRSHHRGGRRCGGLPTDPQRKLAATFASGPRRSGGNSDEPASRERAARAGCSGSGFYRRL
jgi:hypothetical protein